MIRFLLSVLLAIGLSACSQGADPDKADILAALNDLATKKACVSSTLFTAFPISKTNQTEANQDIIQPFVELGFIANKPDEYTLSEKGQLVYDRNQAGFCYTNQFKISDISVVKKESGNNLPPALSGVWYVRFNIEPESTEEWVLSSAMLQVVSHMTPDQITKAHSFTVRLAKKHGEEELIIADPRFSFNPGMRLNTKFTF